MIQGHATPEGTVNFSKKNQDVNPKKYVVFEGLTL